MIHLFSGTIDTPLESVRVFSYVVEQPDVSRNGLRTKHGRKGSGKQRHVLTMLLNALNAI